MAKFTLKEKFWMWWNHVCPIHFEKKYHLRQGWTCKTCDELKRKARRIQFEKDTCRKINEFNDKVDALRKKVK